MKTKENSNLIKSIDLEDFKKELLLGKNYKALAKIFNASTSTIGRFIRKNNLKSNKRDFKNPDTINSIRNTINDYIHLGYNKTTICKLLHINSSTLNNILRLDTKKN